MKRSMLVTASVLFLSFGFMSQCRAEAICGTEYFCKIMNKTGAVSKIRVSDRTTGIIRPYWVRAMTYCLEWDSVVVTITILDSQLRQKQIKQIVKGYQKAGFDNRLTWIPFIIEKDPDSATEFGRADVSIEFFKGTRGVGLCGYSGYLIVP